MPLSQDFQDRLGQASTRTTAAVLLASAGFQNDIATEFLRGEPAPGIADYTDFLQHIRDNVDAFNLFEVSGIVKGFGQEWDVPVETLGAALNQCQVSQPDFLAGIYSEGQFGISEDGPTINIAALINAGPKHVLVALLKDISAESDFTGYPVDSRDETISWLQSNPSLLNPSSSEVRDFEQRTFNMSDADDLESVNLSIKNGLAFAKEVLSARPDVLDELKVSAPGLVKRIQQDAPAPRNTNAPGI